MGCGSSTDTSVQPLRPDELNGDEDETGSKHGGRGDSAVSKGTTDSGVVMENREVPALPGAVPRKLPPLTFVRESEAGSVTQGAGSGLLQQKSTMQEHPKSSEILKELLNQGIIPVDQTRERGSGAGEAYNIMLDDREEVRRRPPARLESLKTKKVPRLSSREEIEEKIRLAEERRKLREDELKRRLRTKSARVRGPAPASSTEEDEDATITLMEPLQSPLTPDPTSGSPLYSQIICEAAEGGECVREAGGDGRESREEVTTAGKKEGMEEGGESGDNSGEGRGGAEKISEDGDGEELTQVEELKAGQLLSASGELEHDASFQRTEDKEEVF